MSVFKSGMLVALAAVAQVIAIATPSSTLLAQSSPQAQSKSPQAPKPAIAVPNAQVIETLVFSTLIALNQANITGNYTVFRELGAPGFQGANSAARLAEIFTTLRNRNLDITPILLFKLQLQSEPHIEANGMLRVTGYFPTVPEQVNFDLLYQLVQGRWRLFGIAASISPPAGVGSVASQGAPGEPPQTGAQPQPLPPSKPSNQPLSASKPSNPDTPKQKPLPDVRDRIHQLESAPNP